MKDGKVQILLAAASEKICEQAITALKKLPWLEAKLMTDIEQAANQIFTSRLELDGLIIAYFDFKEWDFLLSQWASSRDKTMALVIVKSFPSDILRWRGLFSGEELTFQLEGGRERLVNQCLNFANQVQYYL